MAYYYGDDPASQYNQSDANGMQQRKLKQRRLGQAITGSTPAAPDEAEPPVDTPPAPTTGTGYIGGEVTRAFTATGRTTTVKGI